MRIEFDITLESGWNTFSYTKDAILLTDNYGDWYTFDNVDDVFVKIDSVGYVYDT